MPSVFHPQSHLNSQPSSFSFHAQQRDHAQGGEEPLPGHRKLMPLPQIPLTLLKSSEVALISFHVLFRSWIQMQKNSSKDLSWVKNIGWKSLQVSLAGGKRRERREEVEKGNDPGQNGTFLYLLIMSHDQDRKHLRDVWKPLASETTKHSTG